MGAGFTHDRTRGEETWLTPPHIVTSLGPFDLDPCAAVGQPWSTATKQYTIPQRTPVELLIEEQVG